MTCTTANSAVNYFPNLYLFTFHHLFILSKLKCRVLPNYIGHVNGFGPRPLLTNSHLQLSRQHSKKNIFSKLIFLYLEIFGEGNKNLTTLLWAQVCLIILGLSFHPPVNKYINNLKYCIVVFLVSFISSLYIHRRIHHHFDLDFELDLDFGIDPFLDSHLSLDLDFDLDCDILTLRLIFDYDR